MTEPTLDRRQVLKLEAATMAALAGGMPSIAGAAVAYVLDDVQLAVAIARSKDPSAYIISDKTFSKAEPYRTMLRKDDAAFKAVADRTTAELYRSPEIEALYKKWLESPVPPNGLNFNTLMSAVLRQGICKSVGQPGSRKLRALMIGGRDRCLRPFGFARGFTRPSSASAPGHRRQRSAPLR